jgi:starch-binding outer membrane protein SusE/F
MKQILKTFLFTASLAIVLFACEKVEPLVVYKNGVTAKLQASATTIAPKVTDSLSNVVTFNWTNPQYATDSSTVKYVIQIDSSGRNFSKAASVVLKNKSSHTMVAKDLNAILLNLGFKYNTAYKVDVRVVTSYANNNEQLASNVLTLTMTPYVVPPKVTPPASKTLFLVGSATAGGWNNPVPVLTQQFTRVDSVTYQGKFYLNGGQQYLALPVNGSWDNKYSVANNNAFGLAKGGDFGFNLADNFPAPAVTGIYTIKLDFQAGKFTVTLDNDYAFLYVPGGYQSWTPSSAPTLASPAKDGKYNGFVYFNAASEFKLVNMPDWAGTAYGAGAAGKMSTTGGNLSVASAGLYLINANTVNNDYSATRTTWGIVGAFSDWGGRADTQLTYNVNDKRWTGTLVLTAASPLKFRANSGWDINLGDPDGDGVLEFGADNINLGAGTYKVELNLSNAGYYTYSFIKQ